MGLSIEEVEAAVERLKPYLDGVEEDALDELVHDAAQKLSLDQLNALESPEEQEAHISGVEQSASYVNNGGQEAQLHYLLTGGMQEEALKDILIGISDVRRFTKHQQTIYEDLDWVIRDNKNCIVAALQTECEADALLACLEQKPLIIAVRDDEVTGLHADPRLPIPVFVVDFDETAIAVRDDCKLVEVQDVRAYVYQPERFVHVPTCVTVQLMEKYRERQNRPEAET